MKKLIAFLLAAIMLLSLCACKKERKVRDRDVFADVFLYPEELNDEADFTRVFGGKVENCRAEVENYKLHGVTGEVEFQYFRNEYSICFKADFWGEDRVDYNELPEGEMPPRPSAEQSRAAEQYFADLYSFYKANRWGEPTEKDHEYAVWLFDTTGDDSFFLIELDSDDAIVDVIYSLDGVLLE